MFNSVLLSVLVSGLVGARVGRGPRVVRHRGGHLGGATGAASTRADSSPEIATRLAVVGPYAAAAVEQARLVRAASQEHHDRRRVRPHPSPMRRNCVPLSGCSR